MDHWGRREQVSEQCFFMVSYSVPRWASAMIFLHDGVWVGSRCQINNCFPPQVASGHLVYYINRIKLEQTFFLSFFYLCIGLCVCVCITHELWVHTPAYEYTEVNEGPCMPSLLLSSSLLVGRISRWTENSLIQLGELTRRLLELNLWPWILWLQTGAAVSGFFHGCWTFEFTSSCLFNKSSYPQKHPPSPRALLL